MEEDVTESELIAGFIQWASVNRIPLHKHSYQELEEFIMRYLKAAG